MKKGLLRRPTRRDFEALEFSPPEPRRYWTANKATRIAILFGLAALVEFIVLWLLYNPDFFKQGVHPAIIPWFETQASCEETGRVWVNQRCMDYDHNRLF